MTSSTPDDAFDQARLASDEFSHELGRFIQLWSSVELALYKLVLFYAGIDEDVGRALLSGTRTKALIQALRTLSDTTERIPADRRQQVKTILSQIAVIGDARDEIVHNTTGGLLFGNGEPKVHVSKVHRATRIDNATARLFTAEDLRSMIGDSRSIFKILQLVKVADKSVFEASMSAYGLPRAWRYKSLQPTPKKPANRNDRPRRQRPRSSSHE